MPRGAYRGRGRGNKASTMHPPPAPASPTPPNHMPETDNLPEDTVPDPEPGLDNKPPMDVDLNEPKIPSEGDVADPEMDETVEFDGDVPDEDGEGKKRSYKPPWWRPKGTRLKRKKKKVPGVKNLKVKKYVQPKNAVMCLNELVPGASYITEQEGGFNQPFCVSVMINEQQYRGFGSSKQLAKQAAAEAALISFVKLPSTTTDKVDDKTPWTTIVSFAMYKLFNDWRKGCVGMSPTPSQPHGATIIPDKKAVVTQADTTVPAAAAMDSSQNAMVKEAINAHLGDPAASIPSADPKTAEPKALRNPAKQIPENASTMHPVMLLHQMKPGLVLDVKETVRDGKPFFITTTNIDDKEFCGEGASVKKSKLSLAKTAMQGLYGVEYSSES